MGQIIPGNGLRRQKKKGRGYFSIWIENVFLFLEGRNVGNYFQDKSVSKRVELFFEIHD